MADSTLVTETKVESQPETIILKPSRGWVSLNLKDLWRYRELAFFLTWRDIKVRYKQTLLGAAWAIIQPVLQMLIFNFLFGSIANISTGDLPRAVFTYSALLPWNLFSKALSDAGRSLVASRNMITKVYFPRLLIPVSTILSGVVDFAIAFLVLLGMLWYYDVTITAAIWTLPLFLLLALVTALGIGLWLSAWNVHYRDVRYMLPFLTQVWMLATPIAYPLSEVADKWPQWEFWYSLNPMVGVVEGFRWAILGSESAISSAVWLSIGISIFLLFSGILYFRRMERTFADTV
ncbi:MAG: ABC transporter permease [Chloroflexota bacterium]